MKIRLLFAPLMLSAMPLCVTLLAQQTITVEKLVQFMESSIKQKEPDKQVAAYVSRVKLTEKLDDAVIEKLQNEGLGPSTVAALRRLGQASGRLAEPAAPVVAAPKAAEPTQAQFPPPPPEKQRQIIEGAREYALNYSKMLPNFICAQVTKRFGDPTGAGNYRQYDRVVAKLSYYEQHEKYEVVTVNDSLAKNSSMESLGGSVSTGEFGSMLHGVFDPQSATDFRYNRYVTFHKQRTYVFDYSVDQEHSRWQIEDRETKQHIVPAYTGSVWINADDFSVLALTLKAVDIPSTFPITEADSRLDYAPIEISGVAHVLPSSAMMHLRAGKNDQKNEIEFRLYHEYSASTTLKFGDIPDDTPAEKPKQ